MARKHKNLGENRPTAQHVAALGGVSVAAVSRTFTPGASVSARTRQRVLDAAQRLGYQPSVLPKIMQTGRSNLVAMIGSGYANPFSGMALDLLCARFKQVGKHVLLVDADDDENLEDILIHLARYRVDGVISLLPVNSEKAVFIMQSINIPVVTLDPGLSCGDVHVVCSDNRKAGQIAARHLMQMGAHKIAHIGGRGHLSGAQREEGFIFELRQKGSFVHHVEYGDFSYRGGYDATLRMFSACKPDAIFCANDLMGLGCIDAVKICLGLRVPKDVMVMGHDDIEMADWGAYQLSTLRMDTEKAVDAIVNTIVHGQAERLISYDPIIIERASSIK